MTCREGRADPEMHSAKRTTLCRALQSWFEALPYHTEMHSESQYTFYGPWIESFQDCWWDPEFPQLSQMVQSLPGFLNLSLDVCSPRQVLRDVLEAAHPLHRGPTDHKRSVGEECFIIRNYILHNTYFFFFGRSMPFIPVMAKLNFQQHYSSLQCHMILQKSF